MISEDGKVLFKVWWKAVQADCYQNAVEKGWWEEDRGDATCIALMYSELSEALEGSRHGNPPSDKIPEFSSMEEELADTVIRIMDLAGKRGYRISEAILAKMEYNKGRPHKHGGKEF